MAARTEETRKDQVQPVAAQDPLWFKDAIIYQIHVRAYADSNGDGIGDFKGLTEKLDYIQELGVTAIWLQPFFPSPLKDDGYDTADYRSVNPIYGNLRDFKAFLKEAHKRDLRVITEMVMNHTSDQHEWFQKSRRARPGDKWRDYYVWSDTPEKYQEARIIFQDFEQSNWSWDPIAQAHFWHRFYHHQPDLNFENPEVRQAMLDAVEFWLEMGVDGFRLDAVPYLYEREGTNCENLPETHQFLKEVRAHIDAKFPDKMMLAEANQWPEDAAAYFGDGDECQMNFHFPLMPRLFMAIEREDRFPVLDILDQTPAIPETCQWGIFLRNHDELTLEMVTDEERDYMYRAYAEDQQARINLGIRRRLAPLMKNNRRKIELMNALLLSLPGTPIIYYGDELGMGDNIFLGDRNGVRTPMQWNADRNAGFSRASPQALYLPPIIEPEYHYAALNVEIQQNSPDSLLWWMRRIIRLRKQYAAFGRGSIEFLTPDNAKVLAYLRQHQDETILVVANLSRFSQSAELDLSRFRGQVPIELFGQTRFPPIGELPYFMTLAAHTFYWFRLSWEQSEAESLGVELPSCTISGQWDALFTGRARGKFEKALPAFLKRQRWFGGKARAIQTVDLLDVIPLPAAKGIAPHRLLLLRVNYVAEEPEIYLLPVIFAQGEQAANIVGDHPRAGILQVERSDHGDRATLCEAVWEPTLWRPLYDAISKKKSLVGEQGEVSAEQTHAFRHLARENGKAADKEAAKKGETAAAPLHVTVHGGEQSNTSVLLGDRLILKAFRRLSSGENPDLEIGRFLTEETKIECVPKVAGALVYQPGDAIADELKLKTGQTLTIGILHEQVPNQGDAWIYTLDELGRFIERVGSRRSEDPAPPALPQASLLELAQKTPPDAAQEMIGGYLQAAELLGQRTAEMHLALAGGRSDAFEPEPYSMLYQRSLYQSMRTQTRQTFALLKKTLAKLPDDVRPQAERVAAMENDTLQKFGRLKEGAISATRMRVHGDYHLGQVLWTGNDFMIIDFEGEPLRPISERRIKVSPLKDVAGMIRSLHYASFAALHGQAPGGIVQQRSIDGLDRWLQVWYGWTAAAYLRSYLEATQGATFLPSDPEQMSILLDAYLLEKAIYELVYELNNRPDWVRTPLEGILRLVQGA